MKVFLIVFSVLLCLLSVHSIAQETLGTETKELIQIDGEEGQILVFPEAITGPGPPIVPLVMFGVYEPPEIIVDSVTESFSADVVTISFVEGERFSGWFELPEEQVLSIWINGWFIPWSESP